MRETIRAMEICLGRKNAKIDQQPPQAYAFRVIDDEHIHGGSPHRGCSAQDRSVPNEVRRPNLDSRVEEPSQFTSFIVETRDVRCFMEIASGAAYREVGHHRSAHGALSLGHVRCETAADRGIADGDNPRTAHGHAPKLAPAKRKCIANSSQAVCRAALHIFQIEQHVG